MASAASEPPIPANKPRTLMAMIFGDGDTQAETRTAAMSEPTQRTVSTIAVAAPTPSIRPDGVAPDTAPDTAPAAGGAPIPAQKSGRLVLATRAALPADDGQTALSALAALDPPPPLPRVLMTAKQDPDPVTAYLPAMPTDPEAQRALRMLIERETTAATPNTRIQLDPANIRTASLGGTSTGTLKGMFDLTFNALTGASAPQPMVAALAELAESRQPNASIRLREVALVAPELDHVNETLVHPVPMSSTHFAVLTEAEGHLDKGTELGPFSGHLAFRHHPNQPPAYNRFLTGTQLLQVAAR
jgi:hypothetical protein